MGERREERGRGWKGIGERREERKVGSREEDRK